MENWVTNLDILFFVVPNNKPLTSFIDFIMTLRWDPSVLKLISNQQTKPNICHLAQQRTGYLALLPQFPTNLPLFLGL